MFLKPSDDIISLAYINVIFYQALDSVNEKHQNAIKNVEKKPVTRQAFSLMYPEPESNRHASEGTGV